MFTAKQLVKITTLLSSLYTINANADVRYWIAKCENPTTGLGEETVEFQGNIELSAKVDIISAKLKLQNQCKTWYDRNVLYETVEEHISRSPKPIGAIDQVSYDPKDGITSISGWACVPGVFDYIDVAIETNATNPNTGKELIFKTTANSAPGRDSRFQEVSEVCGNDLPHHFHIFASGLRDIHSMRIYALYQEKAYIINNGEVVFVD